MDMGSQVKSVYAERLGGVQRQVQRMLRRKRARGYLEQLKAGVVADLNDPAVVKQAQR